MEWVLIRSWHIVRTWTRMPGRAITLCGRTANPTVAAQEHPPGEGRTCERCFQLRERAT